MTKIIEVRSTWKSVDRIEIPEDFEPETLAADINDSIDSVPEDILDQITSSGAELTDWHARVVEVT